MHVGFFVALMSVTWIAADGKARLFEGSFHPRYETRHVVVWGGEARCEDSPAFCRPFAFAAEWRLWF